MLLLLALVRFVLLHTLLICLLEALVGIIERFLLFCLLFFSLTGRVISRHQGCLGWIGRRQSL